MKLKEFLSDTLKVSRGSMGVPVKGVIEGYRERYNVLSQNRSKKFSTTVYDIVPSGRVIVHVRVPSETVDDFHYDVLLEFSGGGGSGDFGDHDIRVFSNCPSFVYSIAYVMAHWDPDGEPKDDREMLVDSMRGRLPRNRMLIPGSEVKLGRRPVHEQPVVRNPMGIPLFDKSLYFAIFHVMDNLDCRSVMSKRDLKVSMAHVMATIPDFDSLMVERKRRERKTGRRRAGERAETRKIMRNQEAELRKTNSVRSPGTPRKPGTATAVSSARSPMAPRRIGGR